MFIIHASFISSLKSKETNGQREQQHEKEKESVGLIHLPANE
jgi:hypothetical protein